MKAKPARFIERILEQNKIDARRIAELEAKLSRAERATEIAVAHAVATTQDRLGKEREVHLAEVMRLTALHDADWAEAARQREELQTTVANQREVIATHEATIIELESSRGGLARALAGARAELTSLADVDARRAELEHICDGVRERMRKREREAERAILNRRALVGLAPEVNRG